MDDIVKRIRQQPYFGLEPYEAANEITTLRQRVAELEKERDSAYQLADNYRDERDALKQQRDYLLAVLEELSLYVAYNGDDWVQRNAKAAIASVKEK